MSTLDHDWIAGVLAVRAGFVSPDVVLRAAALNPGEPDGLVARLHSLGALTSEQRQVLERLVKEAVVAVDGRMSVGPEPTDDGHASSGTFDASASGQRNEVVGPSGFAEVPFEREGQYTRLRELGRGAQSTVLLARDEVVGREVAMKQLSPTSLADANAADAAARARFVREARLLAELDHPGIVGVLELVRRADGSLVCVQKLVGGETLKARLSRCSTLRERLELLPSLLAACQAVGFAHSKGVVHRDLKPSNMMIGSYGETVVVDWGLAKRREEAEPRLTGAASASSPELTVAGTAFGTPQYMSPEQARGDLSAIDARSDVFSLGAVLYEVLTGRPPFAGGSVEAVLADVRVARVPRVLDVEPLAPLELVAIAEGALRADPAARYGDAEGFAKELSSYLSGGRVGAYRYGPWELLRKFAAQHRALVLGTGIALVALLLAGAIVAVRLHLTRVELASSFLDRAHRAERDGDATLAAGYFAASRAQHDTLEARWGLAVARERQSERVPLRQGSPEEFLDVTRLADGRVVAFGRVKGGVALREVESGKLLWSAEVGQIVEARFVPDALLRVRGPSGWTFYDAATGEVRDRREQGDGVPCLGPFPGPVQVLGRALVVRAEDGSTRTIANDLSSGDQCTVSSDRQMLAYQDSSPVLHVLSLASGKELVRQAGEPVIGLHFSPHGVVAVRHGRVTVLGGEEGEFSIELPDDRRSAWSEPRESGGTALSPDGHLIAFASPNGARTLVVDLASRSIRAVLHHAPGWPGLGFSSDGSRIFAAGLANGSVLSGWRLPPSDLPRTPRWWTVGVLSQSGRASLLFNHITGRYELERPVGTLVARGTRVFGLWPRLVGDGPLVGYVTRDSGSVVLFDAERDRVVWERPCPACRGLSTSSDGSIVAFTSEGQLEAWDTRQPRRIYQETGPRSAQSDFAVSDDGRQLAWSSSDRVTVRELASGRERFVPLDAAVRGLSFSPDGKTLATVSARGTRLSDTASGQTLWTAPSDIAENLIIRWSTDGRSILVARAWVGTEVLDARTGERQAWFQCPGYPVSPVIAELYSPNLRVKAVTSATTWDIRPLPPPDAASAAESLSRTLRETGLGLRGVELVAAP